MAHVLLACVGLLGLTVGCDSEETSLFVDLRTDLRPGDEFTSVAVELDHGGGVSRDSASAFVGADYVGGQRVAELSELTAGPSVLSVTLLRADGSAVISRDVRLTLEGQQGVTVVLTRSCRDVVCPGAGGDPSRTECARGRCVVPECHEENAAACGPVECEAAGDCDDIAVSCVDARCQSGTCFYRLDDGRCGPGQTCDPVDACIGVVADAGPDADGGPLDTGAVDTGVCTGCIDSVRGCVAGDGNATCGRGGGACAICPSPATCGGSGSPGVCGMPACGGGVGSCEQPIRLCADDVVMADTCGAGDHADSSMCPSGAGTEDVVLYVCGNVSLMLTDGFGAQVILDDGQSPCGGSPSGCVPVVGGVSGACGSSGFWLVVERLDGSCGPFSLMAF